MSVYSSLQDEMNRTLDNFLNRENTFGSDWRPAVDITETEVNLKIKDDKKEGKEKAGKF